jgi:hypothetical protein
VRTSQVVGYGLKMAGFDRKLGAFLQAYYLSLDAMRREYANTGKTGEKSWLGE